MEKKSLVIVESPAKARSIGRYLGRGYQVLASFGHVRDLDSDEGSVDPQRDFAMTWKVDPSSKSKVNAIASALKGSERLILATDPDREGEAISWHLVEILAAKRGLLKDKTVERITFNAITKRAIKESLERPRAIDMPLVEAYLARRALDYLFGYSLSPILWRKLPGARSAGRVQSVALRLVCDRETEIEAFVTQTYWSIVADLRAKNGSFRARLVALDERRLEKLSLEKEEEVRALEARLRAARFVVQQVETKPVSRNPFPPFTTASLQQEASRRLRMNSATTMRLAQQLYEGVDIGGQPTGLITYMRTDGVHFAPEALSSARKAIQTHLGDAFVPKSPRMYKTKARNAQEAHEAIRPTDFSRHPDDLKAALDKDQWRLYDLIWRRAVACQASSARFDRTVITVEALDGQGKMGLRASGQVMTFSGFLALYQDTVVEDDVAEEERKLPRVDPGETLTLEEVVSTSHNTEPPPRYTEATLIRAMEEIGIGRPSTYTSILTTIRNRGYVVLTGRRLFPETKGRLVTAFLTEFFPRYVEFGFTVDLEEELDAISRGEEAWRKVMDGFWKNFSTEIDQAKGLEITQVIDRLNETLSDFLFPAPEDGTDARLCPSCKEGTLSLKLGRYGAFIGCSRYPECTATRRFGEEGLHAGVENRDSGQGRLGVDPQTGEEIRVIVGRFGPYVQRGEKDKAKRVGLGKGADVNAVTLEEAMRLLSLPRLVGLHPETQEKIEAGLGRYGPYLVHQRRYVSLQSQDELFTIGINHAVALLANKGKQGRGASEPLRSLGEHPREGGEVTVQSGRFGPYVKHGKVNASVRKPHDPQTISLDDAVALLDARAKKTPSRRARGKSAKR